MIELSARFLQQLGGVGEGRERRRSGLALRLVRRASPGRDLGYDGVPFSWDEDRRHRLKCELDATFAHLYRLDRPDLEWILDAPYPSASFPGLKRKEMKEFGEYRTQRYVLHAYDQMARGELPDLEGV